MEHPARRLSRPSSFPFDRRRWSGQIPSMNFNFNICKATEVACQFLQREGGTISTLKLVKLIYMLDRLSLDRRGIPVVGGDYLSLRNGPVISEVLDLINAGQLAGADDPRWQQCVSDRLNHQVHLETMPARKHLADAEVDLIDEIWAEHGGKDQWQLRDWCHRHCAEWTPLTRGWAPIAVERIGQALGKSPQEIQKLTREAAELNTLDEIFATA